MREWVTISQKNTNIMENTEEPATVKHSFTGQNEIHRNHEIHYVYNSKLHWVVSVLGGPGSAGKSELMTSIRDLLKRKREVSPLINPWMRSFRCWAVGRSEGSKFQHSWMSVQSSCSACGRLAMSLGGDGSRWCFRLSMISLSEVNIPYGSSPVNISYCS